MKPPRLVFVVSLGLIASGRIVFGAVGEGQEEIFIDPDLGGSMGIPAPDWSLPLVDGLPVVDPGDADLSFDPLVPSSDIGPPTAIFATDPAVEVPALREIVWTYDVAEYGRFLVWERIVDARSFNIQMAELAATDPGCVEVAIDPQMAQDLGVPVTTTKLSCATADGSASLIRGGSPASVIEGDVATSVSWVEPLQGGNQPEISEIEEFNDPALLVSVIGPGSEITRDEVIEIANLI